MKRKLARSTPITLALSALPLPLTGCVENGLKASAYNVNIAHVAPEHTPRHGAGSMIEPRSMASVAIDE